MRSRPRQKRASIRFLPALPTALQARLRRVRMLHVMQVLLDLLLGKGNAGRNQQFDPRCGQVVELHLVLPGRDSERLQVDLAVMPGALLEGQNHLGRVLLHQLDHLLALPPDHGLVIDLHTHKQ